VDLNKEFGLGLNFNHKQISTEISAINFVNAPANLSSLSFVQDFLHRTSKDVFVVFSNIDFGVDWFVARGKEALNFRGEETIDFTTWLLQIQYLRRLDFLDSQILLRGVLRIADRPLPGTEKFQLGGHSTVRGYRENSFTLDEAILFSLEYQVPLFKLKVPHISNSVADGQIRLTTFYDYARGEDIDIPDSANDISSVGFGLDWQLNETTRATMLWGLPFRELDFDTDSKFQDAGVHFEFKTEF